MPEPRSPNLLEIKGLNVFYGRSHALQGVDLKLEHGVLSLVGRNGMGKTTLCKAILGLIPAASGTIRFLGEELTRPHPGGDRTARARLRAAGPPAMALAHGR